jgi:hypothetical protein
MKAQLSVKRERSNAKVILLHWLRRLHLLILSQSPVLAAVNGAFAGLVTIRAFNAEMMFTTSCDEKMDAYTQLSRVFYDLNRFVLLNKLRRCTS